MVFERNCFFGKTQQLQTVDKGLLSISTPCHLTCPHPIPTDLEVRPEIWVRRCDIVVVAFSFSLRLNMNYYESHITSCFRESF